MLTVSELNAMPTGAEVISTEHPGAWRKHLEDWWRPVSGGVGITGRLLATFGVEVVERGLTEAELDAMAVGEVVLDRAGEEWTRQQSPWHFKFKRATGDVEISARELVNELGPIRRKLRQRPGDQALPTASSGPSMHDLAIQVLGDRAQIGMARYDQPLRAMNGRDAVRDTIEELADGLAYALQIREERRLLREELVNTAAHDAAGRPGVGLLLTDIIDRYFPEETS